MPVPCILIMPSRANADSPVELRLQEEGKGTYLSEYANFAAALTEGILLLADLRGFGKTTDPAFYTDAKYWNREYRKCNGQYAYRASYNGTTCCRYFDFA